MILSILLFFCPFQTHPIDWEYADAEFEYTQLIPEKEDIDEPDFGEILF